MVDIEINIDNDRTEFTNEGEYLLWANKIRDQTNEIEQLKNKAEALEYSLGESEESVNAYKDALGSLTKVLSILLMDL